MCFLNVKNTNQLTSGKNDTFLSELNKFTSEIVSPSNLNLINNSVKDSSHPLLNQKAPYASDKEKSSQPNLTSTVQNPNNSFFINTDDRVIESENRKFSNGTILTSNPIISLAHNPLDKNNSFLLNQDNACIERESQTNMPSSMSITESTKNDSSIIIEGNLIVSTGKFNK